MGWQGRPRDDDDKVIPTRALHHSPRRDMLGGPSAGSPAIARTGGLPGPPGRAVHSSQSHSSQRQNGCPTGSRYTTKRPSRLGW